jgi:hypothetical protein
MRIAKGSKLQGILICLVKDKTATASGGRLTISISEDYLMISVT